MSCFKNTEYWLHAHKTQTSFRKHKVLSHFQNFTPSSLNTASRALPVQPCPISRWFALSLLRDILAALLLSTWKSIHLYSRELALDGWQCWAQFCYTLCTLLPRGNLQTHTHTNCTHTDTEIRVALQKWQCSREQHTLLHGAESIIQLSARLYEYTIA